MIPQSVKRYLSDKELLFLAALFVTALSIRAINMEWGLPGQANYYSAYVADEVDVLSASMLIGRGMYSQIFRLDSFLPLCFN
jgi:hypothetical protein